MKIRRSLALAAATAALAPAVLLSAPAAFADDTTPAAETSSAAPAPDDTSSTAPSENPDPSGTSQPTSGESTPAAPTSPAAGSTESAAPTGGATTPGSGESSKPTGVPTKPGAGTPAPGGDEDQPWPTTCTDSDDMNVDTHLQSSLVGLPSKIVAGSGFHNFTFKVKNTGDQSYKSADFGVVAARVDDSDDYFNTQYVTLQFQDPDTGEWIDVSLDENSTGFGYLGTTAVHAHESFSIAMRVSVGSKAPAGPGIAITVGVYADDKGNCVYSNDDSYYEFDILAAGTSGANPPSATPKPKPQGGKDKTPLPTTKPAGTKQITPQGELAHTGADSSLPTIALSGGAAVCVGLGVVYAVRRRRNSGSGVAV